MSHSGEQVNGRPCLEIRDLSTGYGKTQILRKVNLSVERGKCVGLIGPNGHGKTTLMRTIGGLHRAWSGSIQLDGAEILGVPTHRLVALGVGHVPQGDLLFGDLTVEEHLVVAVRKLAKSQRQEEIRQVYDLFPALRTRPTQRARSLSGGEKRMLALARGMLLGSSVLLIDEPSLGLAPRVLEAVYAQIAELLRRGTTIVIVEENPMRLGALAELLYLLDRGTIVASGPTEALLRDEALLATYLGLSSDGGTTRGIGRG